MNAPNTYDFLFLALIIVGVCASKQGLPMELLPLGRWLGIVLLGAFVYLPLAGFIVRMGKMSFGGAAVLAYLILAGIAVAVFIALKTNLQRPLESARFFGKGDHVLGMAAGGVKMLCVVIAVMALLNARHVDEAQMAANAKMQEQNFGTINFDTFGTIQKGVVHESFLGGATARYAPFLLIQPRKDPKIESANAKAKAKADALNEVLGN